MKIIIAILIFSFIIIFHELGHFLAAKACGIRVNEFTLGFGPKLVGFTKGETTYCIRLLLFGGACVMEGEDGGSDDPKSFNSKPVWQRMIVVLAGPFFNFILAFIMSVILIGNIGVDKPIITSVMEGYPAEEAGLQADDEIVSLNSYNVHFFSDVSYYVYFHTGEEIEVTYLRDGEEYTTTVTPQYDEESGRYLIGFTSGYGYEKVGALKTLEYGFYEIKSQIYTTVQSLKMLVTGQVGVQDMSGPVGIVKVIGDTYETASADGAYYVFINMLNIAILLSANLGVMNLLPFPALDGGRFLMYVIEAIRRKPAPEKLEAGLNFAGFAILMGLMVLVMISDIVKLL